MTTKSLESFRRCRKKPVCFLRTSSLQSRSPSDGFLHVQLLVVVCVGGAIRPSFLELSVPCLVLVQFPLYMQRLVLFVGQLQQCLLDLLPAFTHTCQEHRPSGLEPCPSVLWPCDMLKLTSAPFMQSQSQPSSSLATCAQPRAGQMNRSPPPLPCPCAPEFPPPSHIELVELYNAISL